MNDEAVVHKESRPSKGYYVRLLLIAAVSLWIRSGFPISAIPNFLHDDGLFIRTARYLEAGQWLGPFDNLTLAKGMFYPLFIDLAFWTSVPLKIAEQIVYLLASALTTGVVRRLTGNTRLSLILFTLLALSPVNWNVFLTRVLRQGLYMSLSLAVVTLIVIIAFPIPDKRNHAVRRIAWGVALGLVSAAYWLTREEGLWLLPACAVIIALALIGIARPDWIPECERGTFPRRLEHWKAVTWPLVVALVVFTAADYLVAGLNYRRYGIFETNEFRAKSFLRAYGAILRIQHDQWRPFITVPKDAWQRAYNVSPAARELAKPLAGQIGDGWREVTCRIGDPQICAAGEVEAGWAMWEFRDAVSAAGHYRSGAEAMRYYATLAHQINAACARGAIPCLAPRATMLPPFRREYVRKTIHESTAVARALFRMVDTSFASPQPSVGPSEGITMFADTADDVYRVDKEPIVVMGWTASPLAVPTLHVTVPTGEQVQSSIDLVSAVDVTKAIPNLKAVRFVLKTDCPITSCELVLDVAGGSQSSVPLMQLTQPAANGAVVDNSALKVYVDGIARPDNHKFTDLRRALKVKIAKGLASVYAAAFPTLAIFGLAGLLLATFLRRRCPIPTGILALGLGSVVAVGTLIVLLAYLKASSGFKVDNVIYTSAGSPFVIIFTTIGIYALGVILSREYRRRSGDKELPIQTHDMGHSQSEVSSMPVINPYRAQWDNYVESWDQQNVSAPSVSKCWPGDEWGNEEVWSRVFQAMFLNFGAAQWENCVEIGPGSGKYTEYLLRKSSAQIVAFDISPAYMEILKKRLPGDLEAGRLHPVLLNAGNPGEILEELQGRQLIRKIDAFYSIDAMVHVDLQYLMAYFITAASCLREDGRLVLTLANATSELGFDKLVKDVKIFYPLQGVPNAKFEWLSPEIVQNVLQRLGFSVQFLSPFQGIGIDVQRDLCLVATLVDMDRAARFREML